jgi:transcriptional regulator with GAF, ATPase, and Fis domain
VQQRRYDVEQKPPAVVADFVSAGMRELYRLVEVVAPSSLRVLIQGETGTGKEVLADAIHSGSDRRRRPVVRVNCAALPETIIESELFGHEAGAFTDARQTKKGLFAAADGSTLFLDEIGELPLHVQAKLLRVLETGEVLRIGSLRPQPVDVRVVTATNRDLGEEVEQGRFREDLYYRLNGVTLRIPPLRERREDIPLLVRLFLRTMAGEMGRPVPRLSDDAMVTLCEHFWPGNVRELKSVIERVVILFGGEKVVDRTALLGCFSNSRPMPTRLTTPKPPPPIPPPPIDPVVPASSRGRRPLKARDTEQERQRILAALLQAGGNQSVAAQNLGVSRRTLLYWLDTFEIPRPRKGAKDAADRAPEDDDG